MQCGVVDPERKKKESDRGGAVHRRLWQPNDDNGRTAHDARECSTEQLRTRCTLRICPRSREFRQREKGRLGTRGEKVAIKVDTLRRSTIVAAACSLVSFSLCESLPLSSLWRTNFRYPLKNAEELGSDEKRPSRLISLLMRTNNFKLIVEII